MGLCGLCVNTGTGGNIPPRTSESGSTPSVQPASTESEQGNPLDLQGTDSSEGSVIESSLHSVGRYDSSSFESVQYLALIQKKRTLILALI